MLSPRSCSWYRLLASKTNPSGPRTQWLYTAESRTQKCARLHHLGRHVHGVELVPQDAVLRVVVEAADVLSLFPAADVTVRGGPRGFNGFGGHRGPSSGGLRRLFHGSRCGFRGGSGGRLRRLFDGSRGRIQGFGGSSSGGLRRRVDGGVGCGRGGFGARRRRLWRRRSICRLYEKGAREAPIVFGCVEQHVAERGEEERGETRGTRFSCMIKVELWDEEYYI